jgi:hypothetical protein
VQIVIVGAVMWPIALPQTKVMHLLRLAWATVVVSNRCKSSQGNAVIQSGCELQRYQAYRLRIQSESKANTSKGWKRITAVSSISVAYWLRIQSEYVKGMETNRCGIKRTGCVSKANTSKGWI